MVTVAGLALVLAGCGGGSGQVAAPAAMGDPASLATPDLDPMAGAPAVGACYRLGRAGVAGATNDSSPVDCYEDHTTLTYFVGTFPDDAVVADPDRARRACSRRLAGAAGLSRRRLGATVVDWIWFEPTTTQWSAGARWFRCDLSAESNGRLVPLPAGSGPVFDAEEVPARYRRCIDDPDGDGEDGSIVTCDRRHDYEWAGPFEASEAGRYPGQDGFLEIAEAPCLRITRTDTWWVTWPLESAWADGDRTLTCYRRAG